MGIKDLILDGEQLLSIKIQGKNVSFKQLTVEEAERIERKYPEENTMLRRKLFAMMEKADTTIMWENYLDISADIEKTLLVKVYAEINKVNSDFQELPKPTKEKI